MVFTDIMSSTYIFFSCCCLTSFVFVWFFVPETKGLLTPSCKEIQRINCNFAGMSLERMDDLFGVTALVEEKVGTAQLAALDNIDRKGDTEERVENVERV